MPVRLENLGVPAAEIHSKHREVLDASAHDLRIARGFAPRRTGPREFTLLADSRTSSCRWLVLWVDCADLLRAEP